MKIIGRRRFGTMLFNAVLGVIFPAVGATQSKVVALAQFGREMRRHFRWRFAHEIFYLPGEGFPADQMTVGIVTLVGDVFPKGYHEEDSRRFQEIVLTAKRAGLSFHDELPFLQQAKAFVIADFQHSIVASGYTPYEQGRLVKLYYIDREMQPETLQEKENCLHRAIGPRVIALDANPAARVRTLERLFLDECKDEIEKVSA